MPIDFSNQAEPATGLDFSGGAAAQPRPNVGPGDIGAAIQSGAGQFGSGVNERLADLYEAPFQIGATVAKPVADFITETLFGLGPAPEYQRPEEAQAFRDVFVGSEPTTAGGRFVRRVGQEVGAALPLAAVPFAAAARPAQQGGGLLQRAGEAFLAGVRNTPGTAATGELAATIGAGTGAGIAQQVAPGSQLAEMTGQLVGGVAPAALMNTPVALGARLIRMVMRRFPGMQESAAREAVARVIQDTLGSQAQSSLSEAEQLRRDIPGFNPSVAEGTNLPSLIRQQADIEARASGQELDQMVGRRRGNEAAVESFANRQAPPAESDVQFVVDTANRTAQATRRNIEAEAAGITSRRQGLAPARTSRAEAGVALRGRMGALERQARDRMTARATELGLNSDNVRIGFDDFRSKVSSKYADPEPFSDKNAVPEVVGDILAIPKGQPITFREYQNLRTRISDDLGDALASNDRGKNRRIRELVFLRREVDGVLDNLIDTASPGLAENARTFRREFYEGVVAPYEKGVAYKVKQQDGRGTYKTADERVADAFLGSQSGARQYRLTFGDDPQANAALRASLLDNLRDATVRNGEIDPKLYQSWLRRNEDVLGELPGLRREVESIGRANESLLARQPQLKARADRIDRDLLNRKLEAVDRGGRSADQLVDDALRNPALMRRLNSRLDGDARQTLRRVVWERANLGDVGVFLRDNRQSLRLVMDPQHLADLEKIANAREIISRVPEPRGRPINVDPTAAIGRQFGQGIPQIGSRIFAVKSGRIGTNYMLVDAGGRLLRGRAMLRADNLMREALYDPQVARDLLDAATATRYRPDLANRLNVRLFNLGAEERREDQTP